jgi:hypothetical protein
VRVRGTSCSWRSGYSWGTLGVLTRYSQGTHGVLTGYSKGTHGVLSGYSMSTLRVLTGFPTGTSCSWRSLRRSASAVPLVYACSRYPVITLRVPPVEPTMTTPRVPLEVFKSSTP